MTESLGCRRCYGDDPHTVWDYYEDGLEVERELVGDSHFLVQLRWCLDCGQRFVWIFGETVDWLRGNDAQRREIVPLRDGEAESVIELDYPAIAALGRDRRHLETDWPPNGPPSVHWSTRELRLPLSRPR